MYRLLAGLGIIFATVPISGAVLAADVPDLEKTPGAVRVGLSKKKICSTKWGKDERHVSAPMKQQVFQLYGYSGYQDGR